MAFGDKVQENGGTGAGVTSFTPTLPGAITAGNIVVIMVTADNVPAHVITVPAWEKSAGMEPVANAQGILWWFKSAGGEVIPAVPFAGNAAFAWRIVEYAGPFDNVPYEISAGTANNGGIFGNIASPGITPTAGQNYLLVAGIGGQDGGGAWNIPSVTLSGFTNGFVNASQQFRQAASNAHIACQVSRVVAAASGAYNTVGTISTDTVSGGSCRVGMTIAFKRGAAAAIRGAKVWTGGAWVEKPAKVWNGASWAQKPVKIWNGTAWV